MALQNAEKSYFRSEQNGDCIQQVIDVPDILAHVFVNKVPALLARKSRGPLLEETRDGRDIDSISWQEFEQLVGEGFRQRGFTVSERGGASPDGGVDLELTQFGKRYLVQCKKWRSRQVSVTVIRELCGVMTTEQAHGGFVVTSGQFTGEAREFAQRSRIELIDGAKLQRLIARETTPGISDAQPGYQRPFNPQCPIAPDAEKPWSREPPRRAIGWDKPFGVAGTTRVAGASCKSRSQGMEPLLPRND